MARAPLYQLPGRPLAYHPAIASHVGGVNAAIVLCQLVYWTPRAKDEEGWIYKTQLELMEETGLTRHEQRAAREALKDRDLLDERYDRVNHQLYFKINVEVYNAMVSALCDNPAILPQIRKADVPSSKIGCASSEKRMCLIRKADFDNTVGTEIPQESTQREGEADFRALKMNGSYGLCEVCQMWHQPGLCP
jgi:hypothetical protein